MDRNILEVLIFEVAGQRHGLSVADVQELLPAQAIMPLPGAPLHVEGVINLRGAIVPVLDVRHYFGAPPKALTPDDHFIVVRHGTGVVALHVDRAVELAALSAGAVAEVEGVGPVQKRATRVAQWRDGMVMLHPVTELVAAGTPDLPKEAAIP